jgi:serine protease inhibitor
MKNPSLRTIGYLIGAICLIVAARSLYSWNSQQPLPFKSSPQLQSVVDGNTAFALDFYRQLKDQPGNLFFSPHSISTCLAMTYVGARAQTESEMASVLHFNAPQSDVHGPSQS